MRASICIIRRRKLHLPGWHYGVQIGFEVIDLDKSAGIQRWPSVESWEQGRRSEHVADCPDEAAAIQRLRDLLAGRISYSLLRRNCEHFANAVVLGRSQSGQVEIVLLVTAALCVAALLALN